MRGLQPEDREGARPRRAAGFGKVRLSSVALITALMAGSAPAGPTVADSSVEQIIAREFATWPKELGGAAVAVRITGRTLFFNEGMADRAMKRPITSDSQFNLASLGKVFDATLLALAVRQGELSLDDPVDKYVTELQQSGDIRKVTLGQLATHTSGLLLPQDHPPWPTEGYTLPEFIRVLAAWKADKRHQPGKQHIYTHAGYILLHLALERRFQSPIGDLIDASVLEPLGMADTTLPLGDRNGRAQLPPALLERTVQGYSKEGEATGAPGDVQGYYHWPGTAQMYSSARDMVRFLAANLGELPIDPALQAAMQDTQRGTFQMSRRVTQGLAWEVDRGPPLIIEKNGGLNNTTTYIGMIPGEKLGVVILSNRGSNNAGAPIGRRIMLGLAGLSAEAQRTGTRN
jgi:beta-lactamase class C